MATFDNEFWLRLMLKVRAASCLFIFRVGSRPTIFIEGVEVRLDTMDVRRDQLLGFVNQLSPFDEIESIEELLKFDLEYENRHFSISATSDEIKIQLHEQPE